MAISTYTELQTAIKNWSKRSDLDSIIPDFIALTEAKIARDIRLRSQVTSTTLTCTPDQRSVALPTGWLEFENVTRVGSPDTQMLYVPIQHLDSKYPGNSGTSGPVVYSIEGTNMLLGPTPDSAYSIDVLYYKRFDPLSTTPTNWLLTNHPSIYLFGALAELAMYTMDDEKMTVWQSRYKGEIDALQTSDDNGQFSGSALRIKVI